MAALGFLQRVGCSRAAGFQSLLEVTDSVTGRDLLRERRHVGLNEEIGRGREGGREGGRE